jgi:hypothetical protein
VWREGLRTEGIGRPSMVFALAKMIIRCVTPSRGFSSSFSEDDHQTSANGAAANAPLLSASRSIASPPTPPSKKFGGLEILLYRLSASRESASWPTGQTEPTEPTGPSGRVGHISCLALLREERNVRIERGDSVAGLLSQTCIFGDIIPLPGGSGARIVVARRELRSRHLCRETFVARLLSRNAIFGDIIPSAGGSNRAHSPVASERRAVVGDLAA